MPRWLSPEERFWQNVAPCPMSGCWLWTGSRQGGAHSGYGRFTIAHKEHYAHRYSWELANGSIPDGLDILHICDLEVCVNPAHMRLGTRSDNCFDMWDKGRAKPGGVSKTRTSRRGSRARNVERKAA